METTSLAFSPRAVKARTCSPIGTGESLPDADMNPLDPRHEILDHRITESCIPSASYKLTYLSFQEEFLRPDCPRRNSPKTFRAEICEGRIRPIRSRHHLLLQDAETYLPPTGHRNASEWIESMPHSPKADTDDFRNPPALRSSPSGSPTSNRDPSRSWAFLTWPTLTTVKTRKGVGGGRGLSW